MQRYNFCGLFQNENAEKTCRRAGVFPALGSVFYPTKTMPGCGKNTETKAYVYKHLIIYYIQKTAGFARIRLFFLGMSYCDYSKFFAIYSIYIISTANF